MRIAPQNKPMHQHTLLQSRIRALCREGAAACSAIQRTLGSTLPRQNFFVTNAMGSMAPVAGGVAR